MGKSVVISNVEAISPLGNSINDIFTHLMIDKRYLKEKFNFISNFDFYNYHYKVKTRVDRCGQFCIHTTAQLVKNSPICEGDMIGLITVSNYGCSNSKYSYLKQLKTLEEKQFASPKDFVQSICNIPNSLATIECGITGFTNHYVGTSDASLTALWQAAKCVKDEIAHEMIISSFETIADEQVRRLSAGSLQELRYSEAAASIKVQLGSNVSAENILFEVLGVGFGTGEKTEEAVEIAMENAVKESDIRKQDVSFIVSNSNSFSEFNKNEKRGIENAFAHEVPTFMMKSYLTECFAPFSLLAIATLSKMSGCFLPGNVFSGADLEHSKYLCYDNVLIKKNSILLLIGYNNFGNAVAVCLKYGK